MSEARESTPSSAPIPVDLDLSAFTAPYDPQAARAAQAELWPTVPILEPMQDGQVWIDWIIAITGALASLIFAPIWLSTLIPLFFLDRVDGEALAFIPVYLIFALLLATFVGGAIWGFFRLRRARSRGHLWWRFERFAAQNGLTYRPWAPVTASTTSLVRGHDRFWFEDRFQLAHSPVDLTVATLVIGGASANFNVGERRWGFVELRLDRSLPHIVLETTERGRAVGDYGMSAEQGFDLEGDFPRYARVYADPEDRATALELLTPDVMAAIVDEADGFDLEVRGDRLAISSPVASELAHPATLARLFRMAAIIAEEARAVAARRGSPRFLVDAVSGPVPERMRQRRIPRGAVRGFAIAGALIFVPTIAGTLNLVAHVR